MDKVSYSLGLGIGQQLAQMGANGISAEDFAQAIKDVLEGNESACEMPTPALNSSTAHRCALSDNAIEHINANIDINFLIIFVGGYIPSPHRF